jgi:hypothetical protein
MAPCPPCNCEDCAPIFKGNDSLALNLSNEVFSNLLCNTFDSIYHGSIHLFDITGYSAPFYIRKIDKEAERYAYFLDNKFPLDYSKKSPYAGYKMMPRGANVEMFTFEGEKFVYLQLRSVGAFELAKEFIFYNNKEKAYRLAKKIRRLSRSGRTITIYNGSDIPIRLAKKVPYIAPSELLEVWNQYVKPQLDRKEAYNHVLFYGKPGCGKTAFCRWIATQYPKWKFIFVPPQVVNKVGVITSVYEEAKRLAPSVVIFEDIDLIGQNRTDTSVNFTHALGELLNNLDGVEPTNRILTIASTNNPASLDPAVTRAGRLGIPLTMKYTVEEKVKILRLYYPFPKLTDEQLAEAIGIMAKESPVDLKMIAKVYQVYEEYEGRQCNAVTLRKLAKMIVNQEKNRTYSPMVSGDAEDGPTISPALHGDNGTETGRQSD